MAKRCFGCMQMKENAPICEHCGYDERTQNSDHQLPVGTVLGGQYTVGKVLGQGGFGITYLAWDQVMNQPVAMKEYFPKGYASRTVGNTKVTSYDGQNAHDFEFNKKRFLREAESLAKLWNIPQIVKILRYFEENGTAYIVMEYVQGINLRDYMKAKGRPLGMEEILRLLEPVAYALSRVHEINLVHRDIAPDNIMILPDGSAKLLDFGAARYVENANAEKERPSSTQQILKHGFAPPEQYSAHGALGPWTDEYALCGTIYYCLTGKVPPEAMDRGYSGAVIPWDRIPDLTPGQKAALEKGMALQPKERFVSVEELWKQLKPVSCMKTEESRSRPKPKRKLIALAAAVLAVMIGVGMFLGGQIVDVSESESGETESVSEVVYSSFAYEENESGWTIRGVGGSEADQSGPLVLPEKYEGKPVTAIGDSAFKNYRNITEIDIPDTVTSIGNRAFSGCISLISMTIPDSVTSIGIYAFDDCNSLTSVNIPDSVIVIDYGAFSGCSSLLGMTIPGSVVSVGSYAFYGCNSLTSVSILDGVTSIGELAFYGCSRLAGVMIPDSVTSIGQRIFSGCSSLKGVSIPGSVTSIGQEAFSGCSSLKDVSIPESVTSIGQEAFSGCISLARVNIPNSVTIIDDGAFSGCSSLKGVTIPSGVSCIGSSVFYGCSSLSRVTISGNVNSIDSFAFSHCSSLTSITIPNSVTSIGMYAFDDCSNLTSVTVSKNCKIGTEAFPDNCTVYRR